MSSSPIGALSDSSPNRTGDAVSSPVGPSSDASPRSALSQSSAVPRTPDSTTRRGEILSEAPRVQVRRGPTTPSTADEKGSTGSSGSAQDIEQHIWGTDVNRDKVKKNIDVFLRTYTEPDGTEPLYPKMLEEVISSDLFNINLNCENLYQTDPALYRHLIMYPTELIPLFDVSVNELSDELFGPSEDAPRRIQVRPFNLRKSKNMRNLDPNDLHTLISIKGMVIRCGGTIPEMRQAYFECSICKEYKTVLIESGNIEEPGQCENCQTKFSMQIIHNRCLFADKQLIRLQEMPDTMPEGQTPHSVTLFTYEDLVDVAKPGDRIEFTGIYKAHGLRLNPRTRTLQSVYRTFIDCIHMKKIDKGRLQSEDAAAEQESEFYTTFKESDDMEANLRLREERVLEISRNPNLYQLLADSLAPSVWEMEDCKKGILCQLFGGTNNEVGAGHGRFRGEINILLCGDPGTAKSQLLRFVNQIAPRGIFTSGKGSSAVGLTAYITKDPDTKEIVLESGALVLSDRGVCCIDEFDKMNDATRSILHEVMEQQTVSLAKAGIVCTLPARTSVLASANPVESRYNPNQSVVQNISLPPTLLSRFDLIYLILDSPNEVRDRRLAKHITSLYFEDVEEKADRKTLDIPDLTAYISYARKNCHPVLTDDAVDALIEKYVAMRRIGINAARKIITATPRQLESLIRLAEALARMKLAPEVTVADVDEAERLMQVATQTAAMDKSTGKLDLDALITGSSASDRDRLGAQIEGLREFINSRGSKKIRIQVLLKAWNDTFTDSSLHIREQDMRTRLLPPLVSEGFIRMDRDSITVFG